MFTQQQAVAWVTTTAAAVADNAAALTKLDQAIGDGDHGANMTRGFRAVTERISGGAGGPQDLGALFRAVSMALIGKVGGASGPLYGSFYLALGKALGPVTEVEDGGLAKALHAGYDAIEARGKAKLEDKTILDALHPALEALDAALAEGKPLGEATDAATDAAWSGVQATIPMIARKGRASYLGERSRDHQDPGATSTHLILKALSDTVNSREPAAGAGH